jgi:hypothetical protein
MIYRIMLVMLAAEGVLLYVLMAQLERHVP